MGKERDTVIDASRLLFDWKELWFYRELLFFFTWRDIKIKYKQTFLGFIWVVLQPLLMMTIFTLFFGSVLDIPSQNLPYPVFVYSGLLVWNMFSTGLANATNSMVSNATIIKKIYFPRLIIPVSSILVALFDFFMAFLVFIPLLFFYQQGVAFQGFWSWPLSIVVAVLATAGPGTLLAALNVKYRDFRYVIPFLLQLLFFLTPVIYPVSMLPFPILKYIVVLTPMYAAVELFRLPLTNLTPEWGLIMISIGSGLIMLVVGFLYFKKTENFFADFA